MIFLFTYLATECGFSLGSSDKKINQGAYPVREDYYKGPDELIITLRRLVHQAIDEHPNPENRSQKAKTAAAGEKQAGYKCKNFHKKSSTVSVSKIYLSQKIYPYQLSFLQIKWQPQSVFGNSINFPAIHKSFYENFLIRQTLKNF